MECSQQAKEVTEWRDGGWSGKEDRILRGLAPERWDEVIFPRHEQRTREVERQSVCLVTPDVSGAWRSAALLSAPMLDLIAPGLVARYLSILGRPGHAAIRCGLQMNLDPNESQSEVSLATNCLDDSKRRRWPSRKAMPRS